MQILRLRKVGNAIVTEAAFVRRRVRNVSDAEALADALAEARQVLAAGKLVVIPTDTVYGIAAAVNQPQAVQALLDAKGRSRDFPPPVLIDDVKLLDELTVGMTAPARRLADSFWPGALTLVLAGRSRLGWDLGNTGGSVAFRVPDHDVTRQLLALTGPLAVSSANLNGEPAATSIDEALAYFGMTVDLYLDAGAVPAGTASTIVDGRTLQVLRIGALSVAQLDEVAQVHI